MATSGFTPCGDKAVATAPNTTSSHEHIQHRKAKVSPHATNICTRVHTHTYTQGEPFLGTTQQIFQQFSARMVQLAHAITKRKAGKQVLPSLKESNKMTDGGSINVCHNGHSLVCRSDHYSEKFLFSLGEIYLLIIFKHPS